MFVKELCDRYNLSSTKSLYSRLKGLKAKGIDGDLSKDGNKSYATEEQIFFLDQLDDHLRDGGTIKNFVPTKLAEVTVHDTTTQHIDNQDISSIIETTQHNAQLTTQLNDSPELLGDMLVAIADKMQPKNPLWYMHELEIAIAKNWKLSTSQIKEMIGTKPHGQTFPYGSFVFTKSGKIGRESAWKVTKETNS